VNLDMAPAELDELLCLIGQLPRRAPHGTRDDRRADRRRARRPGPGLGLGLRPAARGTREPAGSGHPAVRGRAISRYGEEMAGGHYFRFVPPGSLSRWS
jgi:hypothetical protein